MLHYKYYFALLRKSRALPFALLRTKKLTRLTHNADSSALSRQAIRRTLCSITSPLPTPFDVHREVRVEDRLPQVGVAAIISAAASAAVASGAHGMRLTCPSCAADRPTRPLHEAAGPPASSPLRRPSSQPRTRDVIAQ